MISTELQCILAAARVGYPLSHQEFCKGDGELDKCLECLVLRKYVTGDCVLAIKTGKLACSLRIHASKSHDYD